MTEKWDSAFASAGIEPEGPKMTVDPKDLVEGAEVTLRGKLNGMAASGISLSTEAGTYIWIPEECYSAITSVTPPPVDWSKVRRAVFQGEAGDIVAVDGNAAWIRFDRGGNKILALSSLSPIVSLPDTDDAQAGELTKPSWCPESTPATCEHPNCTCKERFAPSTPDTRPAWQRAKVGDRVRLQHEAFARVVSIDENRQRQRLYLKNHTGYWWANNSNILEIVEQAE